MRLNKFLSQSGIASRRKSDELIKMATTEVNGVICFDPAYDVKKNDIVKIQRIRTKCYFASGGMLKNMFRHIKFK